MNIANQLTLARLLLIPVFIVLMMGFGPQGVFFIGGVSIPAYQVLAGIIFILAALTDFLDGYLARKYFLETAFGAFADPMADKLLVLSALVLFVQHQWLPAWPVIIILSRELLVTGLRLVISQAEGQVLPAKLPGKIKTVTQMLAIILYLFKDAGFTWLPFSLAELLMGVCLVSTLYSGWDYFYQSRHLFRL